MKSTIVMEPVCLKAILYLSRMATSSGWAVKLLLKLIIAEHQPNR